MSPTRARKSQARFNPFLAGLLVVLAVIGVVATLDLTGVTNTGLARLFQQREVQAKANMVGVLLPNRMLEPGHVVGRADLWDAQARRVRKLPMEKSEAEENHWATGLNQINGRVLARPKSPNDPFTPDDFLPKGSPPGLVGLVPEGLRLVPIPSAKVTGIDALGFQDHFDLYVNDAVSQEMLGVAQRLLDEREHVSDEDRLRLAQIEKTLSQRLLAQNGRVLRPASSGARSKDKEVSVALHPDDLAGVLAALEDGSTIYCIARTAEGARATARVSNERPDPMELLGWLYEERHDVELIEGNTRSVVSVPRARD